MSALSSFNRPLPKILVSLLLTSVGFAAQAATTYYVRTDGGDASQCTGRADAAYPGSGTAQACAWKNPNIALPASGTRRIAGGDTLLIGSGSYSIGSGGAMQSVPTGPTTTARTRILGKTGAKLVGTNGVDVLSLQGSSNVEIGNLEITDGSDCVYDHSNASATCTSSMSYARGGITASASHNVWLHDLNIHGMASYGIKAGGLADWTVEHVKINKNGRVGWNFNIGTGSSNSGKITLRDIEIAWNGCGERVATGEVWACWAQQTGGYGDGLGTTDTGGQFLVEDAFVHHNTSDGLDFRYMDGAPTTSVTLRRVYSVANAGNQVKVKGNSVIENSVMVSQCAYFKDRYYMLADDSCRASGNTLQLVFTTNNTAVVRHNTITGEGGVLIGAIEGDTTNKVSIQNNVLVGFPTYRDPTVLSSVFYANATGVVASYSGNLVWKVKSNTCPSGSICGQDPKLTNMTLAAFDAEPLAGSPVIDKAPMISAVTTDFVLQPRPSGSANDIGAYEKQDGTALPPPPPTCTHAAPTLVLTGPTTAVAAGTKNTYALNLKNNDGSGCSNTTFVLARTVPSGWSGTLSVASVALAPGASASATLAVTSTTTAAAGSYGIGLGTSSSVGSVHTGNASTTYVVSAPVITALTETVGTDKTTYIGGQKVYMSARVMKGSVAVAGVTVSFVTLKPNGTKNTQTATSDSNGYARASYLTSKSSSMRGTYQLTANAASSGQTATAKTSYTVTR